MGDNWGKGKDLLKKDSKTIIFTKKVQCEEGSYFAEGRGWWDWVKGGVGLNSKVYFWKISVNSINTHKREVERLNQNDRSVRWQSYSFPLAQFFQSCDGENLFRTVCVFEQGCM